jgi:hypothetical protein
MSQDAGERICGSRSKRADAGERIYVSSQRCRRAGAGQPLYTYIRRCVVERGRTARGGVKSPQVAGVRPTPLDGTKCGPVGAGSASGCRRTDVAVRRLWRMPPRRDVPTGRMGIAPMHRRGPNVFNVPHIEGPECIGIAIIRIRLNWYLTFRRRGGILVVGEVAQTK